MSTQIAVRLPDDMVDYLDEQVRSGRARSRAELITRLLAREQRRDRSAADLELIAASDARDELIDSVRAVRRTPLDIE